MLIIFALLFSRFIAFPFYLIIKPRTHHRLALPLYTTFTLCILYGLFYGWRRTATPYGQRVYDPTGQYYAQKFAVAISMNPFQMMTPGNGSDNIDGFLRLYHVDGTLIDERLSTFIDPKTIEFYDGQFYGFRGDSLVIPTSN